MMMFNMGESIINTKTHNAGTVIATISAGPKCLRDLYIIDEADNSNYIIIDECDLVAYDKHYWDDNAAIIIREVLD
jgi:hypothetical protein